MKKTLFALTILLGASFAVSAQANNTARPKKATLVTTNTTTVQKTQKAEPIKAEVITDEQIRADKMKQKEAAKKAAQKPRVAVDKAN